MTFTPADLKARVPWPAKILAKLVLSRLPASYSFWERLSLFKHGRMEDPGYAYGVFRRHFERTPLNGRERPFVALELGPGDSLMSALVAKAHGASATYLMDVGRFARTDLEPYRAMAALLVEKGHAAPDLSGARTVDDILDACDAHYFAEGLSSLRDLPDASVDFAWSHAVLEHVRAGDMPETMAQLRRVLRPDGVSSHCVDLKDHLAEALNNLRFPERVWESELMASSGFYTNRIRYRPMLELFTRAGFELEVVEINRWPAAPTPTGRLWGPYRHLEEDDLLVSSFDAVLCPAREPPQPSTSHE